jgi:SAM-dependent methyltransferase
MKKYMATMLLVRSVVAGFALATSTVALAGGTVPASATNAAPSRAAEHQAHSHEGHGSDHAAAMNAVWTAPTLDVARWVRQFENPQREVIANRAAIVAALRLQPGERVADVGAGTGAYLAALSAAVGPEGHVFAVDISPGFLMHVAQRAGREGWGNVSAVLGRGDNPTLPARALDAIITVNTFHHFEAPETMLAHLARALKPGGRLLVVDFVIDKHTSPERKAMTGRNRESVIALIKAAGFSLDEDVFIPTLRENYALRFRRQ